jgi:hypothetical protein
MKFPELVDRILAKPDRDTVQDVVYGLPYVDSAELIADTCWLYESGRVRPVESDDPSNFIEEACIAWIESMFVHYGILDMESLKFNLVRLVTLRDVYRLDKDGKVGKAQNLLCVMRGERPTFSDLLEVPV